MVRKIIQYFSQCIDVKKIGNNDYVSSWKSKALSDEAITPPTTSDNSLTPH